MSPAFERYIGIDYSGAETPASSLKGLRVYEAGPGYCRNGDSATTQPAEVLAASLIDHFRR